MKNNLNHGYDGLLIVIEGTDGSGKSTQVNLLSQYIIDRCYGCTVSEWKTSRLISGIINEAKEKNMLNTTTYSLLYAADYTDRLENEIIPALKAGFVVLMDRYIYTAYVRDSVRGHDINWVKNLYSFPQYKRPVHLSIGFPLHHSASPPCPALPSGVLAHWEESPAHLPDFPLRTYSLR